MAAISSIGTRVLGSKLSSLQLFTTYARRSLSSKNTYLRKYKHRRNPKISELDVEDMLYSKTSGAAGSVAMDAESKLPQTTQQTANGSWHHSKERLKSLKKTEKIVAAIAVITMLLGYFGIKWMVSVPPNQKIQQQETDSSDTVQQPST